jgi:hypothetical protein
MAFAFFTMAVSANAATVVFEDVGFIKGTGASTSQFRIDGSAPGYQLQISDFAFPTEFSDLGVQITQGNPMELNEIGRWDQVGTYDIGALDAGIYYANVYGVVGSAEGAIDLGLYGVQITTVPVPSGLVLFASAIALLVTLGERRRRNKHSEEDTTASQPTEAENDNVFHRPVLAAA